MKTKIIRTKKTKTLYSISIHNENSKKIIIKNEDNKFILRGF